MIITAVRAINAYRRRTQLVAPPPLPQKLPIAPIFIADSVSLAVSREKDRKLRIVYAGWDDAKVVEPSVVLELQASQGRMLPPPADPPLKNWTPLLTPSFFTKRMVDEPLTDRTRPAGSPLLLVVRSGHETCLISNEDRRCPICLG